MFNQPANASTSGVPSDPAGSTSPEVRDIVLDGPTAVTSSPRVAILLCSFNGQVFLEQQLQSIADQTHRNWELWVSDDGSTDCTLDILQQWGERLPEGRLRVVQGPRRGFAANFLSLVCRDEITADYFAFCDQDDIWDADKLERALVWATSIDQNTPALYCGRTRIVDADGREVGLSPLFARPPSFRNALVQNIGGGNTMVFNKAACDLLRIAGPQLAVVAHDWWAYILVSGCGGQVRYDPQPAVRYRQHGRNLIGRNSGWMARLRRAAMLFRGRFKTWNARNLEALESVELPLSSEARQSLADFSRIRTQSSFVALRGVRASGIYRQTALGNLGLLVAAMVGRL